MSASKEMTFPGYILDTAWEALSKDPTQKEVTIKYDMVLIANLTKPHFDKMGVKDLVLAWKMIMEKEGKPFIFKKTDLDPSRLLWVVTATVVPEGLGR